MNYPFKKIHDPLNCFGRLLFPWFGKDRWGKRKWVAVFNRFKWTSRFTGFVPGTITIKVTDLNGFH